MVTARVIIVGGHELPRQLAASLQAAGQEVTLVEAENTGDDHEPVARGVRDVHGDPLVPATLERAGALKTDVLVACTQLDEVNLAVSLLAKRLFAVPRVMARVNDLENSWMFDASWGVDEALSPASLLSSLVLSGGSRSVAERAPR